MENIWKTMPTSSITCKYISVSFGFGGPGGVQLLTNLRPRVGARLKNLRPQAGSSGRFAATNVCRAVAPGGSSCRILRGSEAQVVVVRDRLWDAQLVVCYMPGGL